MSALLLWLFYQCKYFIATTNQQIISICTPKTVKNNENQKNGFLSLNFIPILSIIVWYNGLNMGVLYMDFMSKVTISASMLLTGFAIVFAVLFFLIFLIWLMGKVVTGAQNKAAESKAAKEAKKAQKNADKEPEKTVAPKPVVKAVKSDGVSDELVAVISAAVYSMYGSTEKVKIKSIRKSKSRSAWANAGVLNNTRPF